jgi:hypothetical protein
VSLHADLNPACPCGKTKTEEKKKNLKTPRCFMSRIILLKGATNLISKRKQFPEISTDHVK